MPGTVVEHVFNTKGSSENKNQKEGERYDLFRNDFSSVNEAQRIREEQEAQKKALLDVNTRKQREQEAAAQLAKDYAQAIKDRDEARQDHLVLKREKLEVEQKSSVYEAKISTYESEKQALQAKVLEQNSLLASRATEITNLTTQKGELQTKASTLGDQVADLTRKVTASTGSMPPRNNLSTTYHGKTVSVVNIAGRQAWDIGGHNDNGDHLYSNRTYNPSNAYQQFYLERLSNGNWGMKSIQNGKYLEVLTDNSGAKINACESFMRGPGNSTQQWWITWVSGGLSFENVKYPGTVIDLYSMDGANISMYTKPSELDRCKLWTILQTSS